jgi:hypothetical protein
MQPTRLGCTAAQTQQIHPAIGDESVRERRGANSDSESGEGAPNLKAKRLEERPGGVVVGLGKHVGTHLLRRHVRPDIVERLERLVHSKDLTQACAAPHAIHTHTHTEREIRKCSISSARGLPLRLCDSCTQK